MWAELSRSLGIQLSFTTAYHPISNGLVERMHRQLKAALMARCSGSDWYQQLPWVLLGMRSAIKEDLEASSAELVYGTPLTLPGELVSPINRPQHPSEFLSELRQTVRNLAPVKMSNHGHERVVHVPKQLAASDFVFVRVDARRSPLQPPYVGPFRIMQRRTKSYKLDIAGRADVISIDRLKPAHIDSSANIFPHRPTRKNPEKLSAPTQPVLPEERSRAGRLLKRPQRFQSS